MISASYFLQLREVRRQEGRRSRRRVLQGKEQRRWREHGRDEIEGLEDTNRVGADIGNSDAPDCERGSEMGFAMRNSMLTIIATGNARNIQAE